MGGQQSGGIEKKSPLGCILSHWKEIGGGDLSKKTLIKYCNQWWPLYKLEDEEKWPFNGTLNYNTLLQLMLFLRREGKWDEIAYADMFFTLRNHPEWQKECGINLAPQDPLVLALEKENEKERKGKLKRCCSACSIGQRCVKLGKIRDPEVGDLPEHYKPPAGTQQRENEDSDLGTPPGSPVSSRTRSREQAVVQAPLREAVGPGREPVLIKVPFSLFDLATWKNVAKGYRSDSVGVTKHFQFLIKQHNPDWGDIQLLLDQVTETEKQLILKTAQDLASDQLKSTGEDIKEHFPLQDPHWNPNKGAHLRLLNSYRDWIIRGMEQAIPKTINWSALYAIRQGPKETPSEFLDKLRDTMRQHTPLDPGSEIGIQQLVSLFIGQSASDIRRKLQKLRLAESRNLEVLLDEAWRVFSNREDRRKDKRALAAALQENKGFRSMGLKRPLGKDQCAWCRQRGHWKDECPERRKEKGRIQAHVKGD